MAAGIPFVDRYRDNAGVAGIARPELKDPEGVRALGLGYAGAVVLAPFTEHRSREWRFEAWRTLAGLLKGAGLRPVALGAEHNQLDGLGCEVLAGAPAAVVAGVMLNAAAVVGNDSGPAHLAALLGRPTVVLTGPTTVPLIYTPYPNVRELRGVLDCAGCRWRPPFEARRCDGGCASLQTVRPAEVVETVQGIRRGGPADMSRLLARLRLPPQRPDTPAVDRDVSFALLFDRRPARIVETGCQRQADDPGAGMSTTVFGEFLRAGGGKLVSLDNDPGHCATARRLAAGLPVEVIQTDSVAWLRAYRGPAFDALYSDSKDTYVEGHAEHCLAEVEAALPHLGPDAAILIDDTWERAVEGWVGKGRLAVPWLLARGWRVAHGGYQTLLLPAGPG
jgi:hypothetical protein